MLRGYLIIPLVLILLISVSFACLPCPLFTQPSYTSSVPENATIGTIALTVLAFNAYSDPINYGTSYLGLNLPFEIDTAIGVIRVIGPLNYDLKNTYEIIVQANVYGYSKSVIATINILNSPDPPQPVLCSPSEIIVLVYENTPVPFNTTQWLNCTQSTGEPFLYSAGTAISIDPLGFVIIEEELNYENRSSYELPVTFTDLDKSITPGYANVSLKVLPLNEYYPSFLNESFTFTFSESISIGTYIGQLRATDEDTGLDGQFIFTIDSGNGSDYIMLTLAGQLYTLSSFDYEENSLFELIVTVSDTPWNQSAFLTNTATIYLQITDENDNRPEFQSTAYYVQVMENASIADHVLNVNCFDKDSEFNAIPVYGIAHQSTNHFSINSSTGAIWIQSELDYESVTSHQVTVFCMDHDVPSYSSQALVIIDVLSINEYNCTFNQTLSVFSVLEDASVGAIIGYLHATDEDSGLAGKLSYNVVTTSSCPRIIQIDDISSAVILVSQLDFEDYPSFTCTVQVSDNQQPITQDEVNITLLLINVNDNPPTCSPVGPVQVFSNTTVGSPIVSLSCIDYDMDNFTYIVETNYQDLFIIEIDTNQSKAVLVLNNSFSVSGGASLQVNVAVTDGYYTTNVPISLFIVFSPSFTSPVYNCTVYEKALIGTVICKVTSICSCSVFYSLSSEGIFTIISTGEIILLEQLDYERTSNYSLTVYSQSPGPLTSSATVIVLVKDSNDNRPTVPEYIFTSITENAKYGSIVTEIKCTDNDAEDNALVSLNITSVLQILTNDTCTHLDVGPFSLNSSTGSLLVVEDTDFETSKSFHLVIECYDKGIPSLTSTSIVMIEINEENEFSPFFTSPLENSLNFTLYSDSQVGMVLYHFRAEDNDEGSSGQVYYSLTNTVSPEYTQLLRVGSTSGELILVSPVSCQYGEQLQYYLNATDNGSPSSTTSISFTVFIADCNLLLIAEPSMYHVRILEDVTIGTILTQVNCNSPIPNVNILYTSNIEDFHVSNETGVVTTTSNLDYETKPFHQLTLYCYYSNLPSPYIELIVYISVLPVNDNNPFFRENNQTIKVREDILPGYILTTLEAQDLDKSNDGELKYFLLNKVEQFGINIVTGEVYVTDYLDRERQDHYTLYITVSDNPINSSLSKSANFTLYIHVLDINDNQPQCSQNVYRVSVSPSMEVGTSVLQIDCHDMDSNENGSLSFSIYEHAIFHINSSNGQLHLSRSITPYVPLLHTISVIIQDHGREPLQTTVYVTVDLDVSGEDIGQVVDNEIFEEGVRNLVAIVIDSVSVNQWSTQVQELLKIAVANSTTTHCNLHSSACSLLPMCINKTSESWTNECVEYLKFVPANVIIHQTPIVSNSSSSLQIAVYVLLPESAILAPFRHTDYVVPQATLKIIIQNNENTISALMRDTINKLVTVSKTVWKELALTFLIVFGIIFIAITSAVMITYFHKNYKRLIRQPSVFKFNKIASANHIPASKPFSLSNESSTTTCTSQSSPDGYSLIDVSEVGTSESTSTNGHGSNTDHSDSLMKRLNSMRSEQDIEFHHPFANQTDIT